MIVSIQNTDRELLVNTVILSRSQDHPDNIFLFHCGWCGYQIAQVKGIVSSMTPGIIPSRDVVVVNRCPRCETMYVFQTNTTLPGPVKLKLVYGHPRFRCFVCRTPLLEMRELSDPKKLFPTKLHCPRCATLYSIVDVL